MREEIRISPGFRVLPCAGELIKVLSEDKRCVLGIATGNIEEGAKVKLERAGLRGFFSFGGFDEDGIKRSEIVRSAIEKGKKAFPEGFEKIYLIGDSHFDVIAAKEAGILSIAVGTDGIDKYELSRSSPDFYFDTLKNISDFCKIVLK